MLYAGKPTAPRHGDVVSGILAVRHHLWIGVFFSVAGPGESKRPRHPRTDLQAVGVHLLRGVLSGRGDPVHVTVDGNR